MQPRSAGVHPAPPISALRLSAYAALQLPLAMALLPVVLNVGPLYKAMALNLSWLGIIFFATRLLDAVQDPLIGFISDRMTHIRHGRLKLVLVSVPFLGAGFYAVFSPPAMGPDYLLVYLTLALILVHLGYSGVSISYHSLGAELSNDYVERTRVTIFREVFGIAGMLAGTVLPVALAAKMGETQGLGLMALIYLPVLAVPAAIVWFASPSSVVPPVPIAPRSQILRRVVGPIKNPRFRRLLLTYLLNGVGVGVAASVVLFFVDDVVHAKAMTPYFVLAYFGAGVLSVPIWLYLARRYSKSLSWFAGVVASTIGLGAACMVGSGDVTLFLVVCLIAGMGLGADYGIPPAILADIIHNEASETQGESGKYFGLWAMATKLTGAIGSGLAFPLLDLMGYNTGGDNSFPLIVTYAILPVCLKAITGVVLWFVKVETERPSVGRQFTANY